jgi:hypothetical protein
VERGHRSHHGFGGVAHLHGRVVCGVQAGTVCRCVEVGDSGTQAEEQIGVSMLAFMVSGWDQSAGLRGVTPGSPVPITIPKYRNWVWLST